MPTPFSKHHSFQTDDQKAMPFTVFSLLKLFSSCCTVVAVAKENLLKTSSGKAVPPFRHVPTITIFIYIRLQAVPPFRHVPKITIFIYIRLKAVPPFRHVPKITIFIYIRLKAVPPFRHVPKITIFIYIRLRAVPPFQSVARVNKKQWRTNWC